MWKQLNRLLLAGSVILSLASPAAATIPAKAGRPASSIRDEIVVTGQRVKGRSDWVRAVSANFTVYGVNEAQTRRVAAKLERFRQFLIALTQVSSGPSTSPTSVYLVKGSEQLDRLRRMRYPRAFFPTGYFSVSPAGALLAADMRLDAQHVASPLFHEASLFGDYTRQFMIENARGAYMPAWYIDGLTVYLTTAKFGNRSVDFGTVHPDVVGTLNTLTWEPMGKIIAGELTSGWLYSAQSVLLVHYICAERGRVEAFQRFLAATRDGGDRIAAFKTAFGMTMEELHSRLWQYRLEAKSTHAEVRGFDVPDVIVFGLPKSADTLLLDAAAMQIGIPEPDRQRGVLRRAESVAIDPKDAYAQRILAKAEILYGTPDRADPILDRLLAVSPDDPELLYLKGLRHLVAGRATPAIAQDQFRAARDWFESAYRVDPDYYPALYTWAESLAFEPRFVSENTINVLLKAAQLASQATQIQVTAAKMMMFDGRFDTADALLTSVVVTPRDPSSEQVPELLARSGRRERADMSEIMASFRYNATWKDKNCC